MSLLLSQWRLTDVEPGGAPATLARGDGETWIKVSAPGDTYLALVEAGRLDDPFHGRNETEAAWVRHREWWWHTRFSVETAAEGEIVELVFDGLDTLADIHLDGVQTASSDNMFRQVRLDVTHRAGQGETDLAVRFHPISTAVEGQAIPAWRNFQLFADEGRALVRKAQYGWGWDWGPDLPTVGVWKPVRIERRQGARIVSLGFATLDITGAAATVRAEVELDQAAPVEISLLDPDGVEVAHGSLESSGALTFQLDQPRLWWTADLGDQPLYTLVARTPGSAAHSRRVGIRTLTLDTSPDPDEPGTEFFRFVLNGAPIFAKGACWIPASSFIGAVPTDLYAERVAQAAAAHMNMLRVWGGGVYEDEAFYDACDAAGLLVWQDFMFACSPYPEDEAFLANVRAEATEQVRRLRAHPCLALWCGNNEIQLLQAFDNHVSGADDRLIGLPIFDVVLPEILGQLDPVTPYRPSSPFGGANPNSMRAGDVHDWTVWHGAAPVPDAIPIGPLMAQGAEGIHYTRYAEDMGRFVSEFGLHGAPRLDTLKRALRPDDLALDSAGFKARTRDHSRKAEKMASLLTGRPETLEAYVEATRLLQAEGLKFGIEHFRRRTPHCSGAVIWQLNDCWPCVSWSLIEHDGVAKPGYFAVKRAFAPVLAAFRAGDGDTVELWITNDTLAPVSGIAAVALARFDGGEDWRGEAAFEVQPNRSVLAWRGEASASPNHALTVRSPTGLFPANRLLLAPVNDLTLAADPGLTITVEGATISVRAERYALAVQIETDDPDVMLDDNGFDLAAGETRMLTARRPVASVTATSWTERRS